MAQHQDNQHRGDTLDIGYSQGRQSSDPHSSQQNAHYGSQGRGDERPPPFWDEQRGYPDARGQEGQYGMAPENRYGNSPTNPYAKNPNGSPGVGEPWRDESYGESRRNEAGFSQGNRPNPSQYAGGTYQGYREQGGYPAGNYETGTENYRSGGYQGGGGLHQSPYENAHGRGYQQDSPQTRPRHGNQEEQRSRGHGEWEEEDHFDPHYRQWRAEQIQKLDEDYRAWRSEYYGRFSNEFSEWRQKRAGQQQGKPDESTAVQKQGKPAGGASPSASGTEGSLNAQGGITGK
jgi:hypothetical protein